MNATRLSAWMCLLAAGAVGEEARTWTATDGRTLEAVYLEHDDDSVKVKREADSRVFDLPLTGLAKADQEWLTRLTPSGYVNIVGANGEVVGFEDAKDSKFETVSIYAGTGPVYDDKLRKSEDYVTWSVLPKLSKAFVEIEPNPWPLAHWSILWVTPTGALLKSSHTPKDGVPRDVHISGMIPSDAVLVACRFETYLLKDKPVKVHQVEAGVTGSNLDALLRRAKSIKEIPFEWSR